MTEVSDQPRRTGMIAKREHYEGEIVAGMKHGKGKYQYRNTFYEYAGDWFENKKHGKGVLAMKDGMQYEGDFNHGEITGEGVMIWPDGATYRGSFIDGERHGHGEFTSPSGEQYTGNWSYGHKQGIGKLSLNTISYEGSFANNTFDGEGRLQIPGLIWSGEFKKGLLNGTAEVSTPNNITFGGMFKNGLRNGEGQLKINGTTTLISVWEDDILAQENTLISEIEHITSGDNNISGPSPDVVSITNIRDKVTLYFSSDVGNRVITATLHKSSGRSQSVSKPSVSDTNKMNSTAALKLPKIMFSSEEEWSRHATRKSIKKKSFIGGDDREAGEESPPTATSQFQPPQDGTENTSYRTVLSFYLPPTAVRGMYVLRLQDETVWPDSNPQPEIAIPRHSNYNGPVHRNMTLPTTIPERVVWFMETDTLLIEIK